MKLDTLRGNLASARVLVVGDVMLDRYWFGSADRISPEAPVPVVRVGRTESRLGGAANVALNALKQGVNVDLLSIRGDDAEGVELEQLITASGIQAYLNIDTNLSTTIKTRVVAQQQQLIRIDFESVPGEHSLSESSKQYDKLLKGADVVVFSDYGKGVLTHISDMIAQAKKFGKFVLIDPKGNDFEKYRGASYITPNKNELRAIVGNWSTEDDLTSKVQALREHVGLSGVLVTRSEEGMTLFEKHHVEHFQTVAREIFDVSGAGDTVIGVLAAYLASGMDISESVRLANKAAGIVVGKLGTATTSFDELFREGF
ncbi:MAG: D-glycero-beta-D-manno-heptose-7-phosphate kinase [Betaproteobacteria bacterium]